MCLADEQLRWPLVPFVFLATAEGQTDDSLSSTLYLRCKLGGHRMMNMFGSFSSATQFMSGSTGDFLATHEREM